MNITVVVNDRMQRGYVYVRTRPIGGTFHEEFQPQLTPKQMLALGVWRQLPDRLPGGVSGGVVYAREVIARNAPGPPQLFRRSRLAVAGDVAASRLDPAAGSTRLVPVVLSVLHGPPQRR